MSTQKLEIWPLQARRWWHNILRMRELHVHVEKCQLEWTNLPSDFVHSCLNNFASSYLLEDATLDL